MSATSHRALRHMAWANQRVYASLGTLPDESLNSYIVNPEWSAQRILQHIVSGADWYVFCLTGKMWSEVPTPSAITDVPALAKMLAEFDAAILSQADLPDDFLTITEEEESWQNLRSTLLVQAVHHATEHRAQFIDALESKGFAPINLDDIDLWAFEKFEKESAK
ncbi:MAG: hypothetical protein NT174_03555 [Actinobacteria bacterium]|nr:hypothetical protein [Actinomycetota bacterium]